jgi:spermidine synthase
MDVRAKAPRSISITVALISATLIVLQIAFTRLLSYRLFYHFVFLAIALSLLGLGAAGTYVAVRTRSEPLDDRSLSRPLAALAILIPLALFAMANPPIASTSTEHSIKLLGGSALAYLALSSALMVAINFVGGLVLTRIFSAFSHEMGRLYARDLIGAAAGCVGALYAMKYLSPPDAFLLATVPAAIPLLKSDPKAKAAALAALLIALALFVGPDRFKSFDGFAVNHTSPVLKYEWNHLVRTEHREGGYIIDGSASTPTTVWSAEERALPVTDPAFALIRPRPSVAIIGFGGGPQVSEARRASSSRIYAIDINPTIARWVTGPDLELNQQLFVDPTIEIAVGEGRHLIRARAHADPPERFDLIEMHAIDTYAATLSGAYALTENFLYTKEAMREFFDALSDDGLLTIRRWLFNPPRENMRLFVTALAALEEIGVEHPERHLAMLAPLEDYEVLRTGKQRVWGYFILAKNPLDEARIEALKKRVAELRWSILYAPGVESETPFAKYVASNDRPRFRRHYPYFVEPATDASPYFFQFYNPLHKSSYQNEGDWHTSALYQQSSIYLGVSLLFAIVASALLILYPLARGDRRDRDQVIEVKDAIYFACLGLGFMAVEVPLTQIFSLYLGHPIYAFSVVLVALLLSSGIGSQLVERGRSSRRTTALSIAAMIAVLALVIFPLIQRTIDLPDGLRFAIALAVVAALGIRMGMPLAQGVRALGARPRAVAWAWAINGSASVVGSCAVMLVMVYFGSNYALAAAVGAYALAGGLSSNDPA